MPPDTKIIVDTNGGNNGDRSLGKRRCFPLLPLAPHIKTRYERLFLVTEQSHINAIEAAGDDGLIVSSDWFLWQRCLNEGRHAVHMDHGILDWDGIQVGLDHLVWASDWMFSGGRDITLFRGASLGQKFFRQVGLIIGDYTRIKVMLGVLIDKYKVKELVFYDCRTEHGYLDIEGRVNIAAAAARSAGVTFTDLRQPSSCHISEWSGSRSLNWSGPTRESLKTRLKRRTAGIFVGLIGRISLAKRRLNKSRPGVLLVVTHITGSPLLEELQSKRFLSMYLGRWLPNKTKLLYWLRKFSNGVLAIDSPEPGLSAEDLSELEAIERQLEQSLVVLPGTCEAEIYRYVLDHVVRSGALRETALKIKWTERVLDEFRPDLVLTDGLLDITSITFLELAKRRGIPNAVTWHGQYIADVKMDMFGGDPRRKMLADFSFTWGKAHEEWLDAIGANTTNIRTGNLVTSGYQGFPPAPNQGNVVVLQFVFPHHYLRTPMSYEYFSFVEVSRMLSELGYSSIRLRFHPGIPKRKYYEDISEYFGLTCELIDTGTLRENLESADIVIGPPSSGAMLETLAGNRPFYPFSMPPHDTNKRYLEGTPHFEEIETLRRHLESGQPLEQKVILENFTSLEEFPNTAERTSQAIEIALSKSSGQAPR